jgi:hypothetical protein
MGKAKKKYKPRVAHKLEKHQQIAILVGPF